MIATPLPLWASELAERLAPLFDGVNPNHMLVNVYSRGQGIEAHLDGPLYFPRAAIISLQSSAVLQFSDVHTKIVENDVFLNRRSLISFSGEYYTSLKHAIAAVAEDVLTPLTLNLKEMGRKVGEIVPRGSSRVSPTFRVVKFVAHAPEDWADLELQIEAKRRLEWWARATSEENA
jgi:hypothetical protein